MHKAPAAGTVFVAPAILDRVRLDVERRGVRVVAQSYGVGWTTLASALAGLAVRRGSAALIERGGTTNDSMLVK